MSLGLMHRETVPDFTTPRRGTLSQGHVSSEPIRGLIMLADGWAHVFHETEGEIGFWSSIPASAVAYVLWDDAE
jgi:hypothetical protein